MSKNDASDKRFKNGVFNLSERKRALVFSFIVILLSSSLISVSGLVVIDVSNFFNESQAIILAFLLGVVFFSVVGNLISGPLIHAFGVKKNILGSAMLFFFAALGTALLITSSTTTLVLYGVFLSLQGIANGWIHPSIYYMIYGFSASKNKEKSTLSLILAFYAIGFAVFFLLNTLLSGIIQSAIPNETGRSVFWHAAYGVNAFFYLVVVIYVIFIHISEITARDLARIEKQNKNAQLPKWAKKSIEQNNQNIVEYASFGIKKHKETKEQSGIKLKKTYVNKYWIWALIFIILGLACYASMEYIWTSYGIIFLRGSAAPGSAELIPGRGFSFINASLIIAGYNIAIGSTRFLYYFFGERTKNKNILYYVIVLYILTFVGLGAVGSTSTPFAFNLSMNFILFFIQGLATGILYGTLVSYIIKISRKYSSFAAAAATAVFNISALITVSWTTLVTHFAVINVGTNMSAATSILVSPVYVMPFVSLLFLFFYGLARYFNRKNTIINNEQRVNLSTI